MDEVFRDSPNWITLQRATRYMRLSMAIYSWTFVFYQYGCTAPCRLLKDWRCCACCRKRPVLVADKVHGEKCCGCFYCGCSMAGLKSLAGIKKNDDFIYCNFHNKIFKNPICIVADHPTMSVVVTVRGTISLIDCFTDVVAVAEKVDMEGIPEGTMAHKGMLLGAKYIKQQLDESKILEKTFSVYPNYRLVFTGHSLGAAVSVLLGLLYKPQHPELKVYAFSCPSVLTLPGAIYCQSFVFTFGVGDDLVMRASLKQAEKLRDQLLEVLQNSKLPKYQVLIYGLGYALCGIPSKHINTMWHDRPKLLPARNHLPYVFAEVTQRQCTDVALYPAGTILHILRKIKKVKSCPLRCMNSCSKCLFCCCCCYCCCKCLFSCCIKKKRKKPEDMIYGLRWVTPDFFNELRVMPRMLLDHLPENVYKVLIEILEEQGIDTTDEEYLQR